MIHVDLVAEFDAELIARTEPGERIVATTAGLSRHAEWDRIENLRKDDVAPLCLSCVEFSATDVLRCSYGK